MAIGVRRAAVVTGLAILAVISGWLVHTGFAGLSDVWSEPEPVRTPAALLGAGCSLLTGLLLGWLGLGALLCALGEAPGRLGRLSAAVSRRVAPAVLRAGVVAALGGALVAGSATVANAASTAPTASSSRTNGGALPGPGWAPRATPAPPTAAPPTAAPTIARPPTPPTGIALVSPSRGRTVDDQVVVRRGETLWAIAARHLGPDATAAEIAHAWPRWYAANRATIGPDPDDIRPGQLLRPPSSPSTSRTVSPSGTGEHR